MHTKYCGYCIIWLLYSWYLPMGMMPPAWPIDSNGVRFIFQALGRFKSTTSHHAKTFINTIKCWTIITLIEYIENDIKVLIKIYIYIYI